MEVARRIAASRRYDVPRTTVGVDWLKGWLLTFFGVGHGVTKKGNKVMQHCGGGILSRRGAVSMRIQCRHSRGRLGRSRVVLARNAL